MFRTALQPSPAAFHITHQNPVLSIGSCFADCLGERLHSNKFKVMSNPAGVIFNPLSLFNIINQAIDNQYKPDPVLSQDIWRDYQFHSQIAANSESELINKGKVTITNIHNFLQTTDYLTITLGTAYIYIKNSNRQFVANCHKIPTSQFSKVLLGTEEITEAFTPIYKKLKELRPDLKIIWTVSPVRHIKDTLPLNTVSKSILRLAAHELSENFQDSYYFPSYELLLDDLRDYRFYAEDMLHPNKVAEDYIFDFFSKTYFSTETQELNKDWQNIKLAIDHKPFQAQTGIYKKHLESTLTRLKTLSSKLNLTLEISEIESRLSAFN